MKVICLLGVVVVALFVSRSAGIAQVQKPAPSFSAQAVVDGDFKTLSLSDYAGKYLVLFFYPLDFTFVCPTELTALSDRIEEFKQLNTEVVAISVDSKFSHLAWTKMPRKEGGLGPMRIPLLSDITKSIARDYGVLLEDGPSQGVALRAMFIINEQGIVRHITVNDLPVGRDVDEILRLVKAFQYTDHHDEVCPVGWRPGQKTMKPQPMQALEYFAAI
ncbi:cTPxI [Balamuthia mandrillaris]